MMQWGDGYHLRGIRERDVFLTLFFDRMIVDYGIKELSYLRWCRAYQIKPSNSPPEQWFALTLTTLNYHRYVVTPTSSGESKNKAEGDENSALFELRRHGEASWGELSPLAVVFRTKRAESWLFLLTFLCQDKKVCGVIGATPLPKHWFAIIL